MKINRICHLTGVCLEYRMLLEILPIHLVHRFLPSLLTLALHVTNGNPVLPSIQSLGRKVLVEQDPLVPNPVRGMLEQDPLVPNPLRRMVEQDPLPPNPLPPDRNVVYRTHLLANPLPPDRNVVYRIRFLANPLPPDRSSVQVLHVQVPRPHS